MANNSKVKLSTAVSKARRKRIKDAEEPRVAESFETPAEAEQTAESSMLAATGCRSCARRGGVLPMIGRTLQRAAYGTVYGTTYTVVFPWALVR